MKLLRFTAADNHKAMVKVHEILGPDALIYTTRRTKNGVEILAAPSGDYIEDEQESAAEAVHMKNAIRDDQLVENINNQLQQLGDHLLRLTENMNNLQSFVIERMNKKNGISTIPKVIYQFFKHFKEGIYGRQTSH